MKRKREKSYKAETPAGGQPPAVPSVTGKNYGGYLNVYPMESP
ncbi:hypothetical protein SBA7_110030 [Candidatus Sulfotelmatobacter sp. SbA7]|nr:hypothetical protein SBA7_110030 [Candidatus Sulfotelmatobacter sp. SbA7]